MLDELGGEIDDALDTLRALAPGSTRRCSKEQGIAPALAAQYVRSGLPVRMDADATGRYPIETKRPSTSPRSRRSRTPPSTRRREKIAIAIQPADGELRFSVRDDGVGFDPARTGHGSGLAGIRDRLAVFGGDATVESSPGKGTVVRGRVPVSGVRTR